MRFSSNSPPSWAQLTPGQGYRLVDKLSSPTSGRTVLGRDKTTVWKRGYGETKWGQRSPSFADKIITSPLKRNLASRGPTALFTPHGSRWNNLLSIHHLSRSMTRKVPSSRMKCAARYRYEWKKLLIISWAVVAKFGHVLGTSTRTNMWNPNRGTTFPEKL